MNVRGGHVPIAPDPNALTAQEQQGLILFGRVGPEQRQRWAASCATLSLKPPNTPVRNLKYG